MTHKDNDRARIEKDLENMMGDDWRVFRAKLVAQEQVETKRDPETVNSVIVEKQEKQAQFSSLFAGAISSIFSPSKQPCVMDVVTKEPCDDLIFRGDGIGEPPCEDPFATADEILAVKKPVISINKHRWAHPISHIEPGCVLVANEKLGGVFHQTVVLIIDHHEATGSTGIIINRPLPGNLLKIASETISNVDLSLKLAFNTATVSYGGPVMQEDYSILHGYGEVDGSKKVAPGVFVGGSRELMNEVRKNHFSPHDALFVKGHAAWVPSQLSREVSKGVWYIASVSPDLILRYAGALKTDDDNKDDLWSDILTCMGSDYSEIAKRHAGRGDMRMMP